LNYSRSEVIPTKTVIRNMLIRVVQSWIHKKMEWNVKVVMEEPGHCISNRPIQLIRNYRARRKVESKK